MHWHEDDVNCISRLWSLNSEFTEWPNLSSLCSPNDPFCHSQVFCSIFKVEERVHGGNLRWWCYMEGIS